MVFDEYKDKIPKFRKTLPWHKRTIKKNFEEDISSYLNWVYDCLYITGHPNNSPLSGYVESPAVKCPELYLKAVRYIKEDFDWSKSELTIKQVMFLRFMLDELLQRLPAEFK
jgi:hypothetical protein